MVPRELYRADVQVRSPTLASRRNTREVRQLPPIFRLSTLLFFELQAESTRTIIETDGSGVQLMPV